MYNKILGDIGEKMAGYVLEREGYYILERNYRWGNHGEIDIVAIKDGIWRIVEVKTRTGIEFGLPCEAVDNLKRKRMEMCFRHFLYNRGLEYSEFRIEIVEIYVNHIKGGII